MKVLFLPEWYPHRGDAMDGLFVRKHAQAVARHADVQVLCAVPEAGLAHATLEERHEAGLSEYYLYYPAARTVWGQRWRKLKARRTLWRAYRRRCGLPDIVHVHVLGWYLASACRIKRRYGIPFVVTEHWSRYMLGTFQGRLRRWVTARLLRKAAAVMPVSEALGADMRRCGLQHPNYQVVRNVVDDFFFSELEAVRAPEATAKVLSEVRPETTPMGGGAEVAACRSPRKRFVHICCFDERAKNNFGLLRAVKALSARRTDFTLYMIGSGRDWEVTRAYAEELGLRDDVVFTGGVTPRGVRNHLAAADFSVLFSRYETASVVVAESLSAGRPVVCSEIPAIAEVMDERTGRMVPVADEAALTDALDWMLDHAGTFDAAAVRERAAGLFSADRIGRQFMEIYQNAIS